MTYANAYSANDLSGVSIDVVAKFGVVVLSFATLIMLVVLFVWLKKKVR